MKRVSRADKEIAVEDLLTVVESYDCDQDQGQLAACLIRMVAAHMAGLTADQVNSILDYIARRADAVGPDSSVSWDDEPKLRTFRELSDALFDVLDGLTRVQALEAMIEVLLAVGPEWGDGWAPCALRALRAEAVDADGIVARIMRNHAQITKATHGAVWFGVPMPVGPSGNTETT